jgi:hypothetical protein
MYIEIHCTPQGGYFQCTLESTVLILVVHPVPYTGVPIMELVLDHHKGEISRATLNG